MRIFIVGGTRFTGPPLVQQLLGRNHEVTLFHRGQTHDPRTAGARAINADRGDRERLRNSISDASPDVVVDMIPFTAEDASTTIAACRGLVPRVVALSSIDVYLAYGRIHRTEPGPPQPTPLTETSALRETDQPGGPSYDKIAVEHLFAAAADLPATILRLPAIHGPRDKQRRLRDYLRRMDDGRETIPLARSMAGWKFSRGYVDNVAHAIALAAENGEAAGEVFNVAEPRAMTELEFVGSVGAAAGWRGEVRVLSDDQLPADLQPSVDFGQDWEVDTTKIRERFGFAEIVPADEGIRRTVEWERANPPDVELRELDYAQEDQALAEATR